MKKKELVSLRSKTITELTKMVIEKRVDVATSYAKIKAGHEKNVKKAFNLRKELAQILTILREKEIIENTKAQEKKEEDR